MIRTSVIDDLIRTAVAGGVDTVVNLGAGLDARPYRLELPASLKWVEVDYPGMIRHKEAVLARERPRCRLERIGLDLADPAARGRLFDEVAAAGRDVLVLTEGVAPYLTEEHVAALARDLRSRGSFRHWVIDYFSPEVVRFMQNKRKLQMQNAPFRFAPADWFAFFADLGWRAEQVRYLAEESERLGRKIPMPLLGRLMRCLMPAEKAARFRKFSAYVMLVPE